MFLWGLRSQRRTLVVVVAVVGVHSCSSRRSCPVPVPVAFGERLSLGKNFLAGE